MDHVEGKYSDRPAIWCSGGESNSYDLTVGGFRICYCIRGGNTGFDPPSIIILLLILLPFSVSSE